MLSDTAIRKIKPGDKPIKMTDEKGLFLILMPRGGKWWRFRYRFDGKQKLLSLGIYPDVPLALARERRDEARRLVAAGVDPGAARKAEKATKAENAANTFEALAREWHAKNKDAWTPEHSLRILRRLEVNVFPFLGTRPIKDITVPEIIKTLNRMEERGLTDTAHRAKNDIQQVFRYAVATGRTDQNPAGDLKGALKPYRGKHFGAITDPRQLSQLLRALDTYQGSIITRCALRLAPLVFVRPGELRHAEWAEIDLEAATWSIPAEKMKMRHPHLIPLSEQAVAILRELYPLTGHGRYVFRGERSHERPMSENTVNAALRYLGYDTSTATGHGFRATARTILDEVLGFRPDIIEHQLAHAVKDPNGRAYNRTSHLPERRRMMQQWADYLDGLKRGAEVIPIHRHKAS